MMKYVKQYFISVNKKRGKKYNKKGFAFLIEIMLSLLLLAIFTIALTTVNINNDYTNTINYYKAHDIFTISVAKQLSQNEIKELTERYIPNAEIYFNNSETTKIECYSKYLQIWKDYPLHKEIIYVKLCF